MPTVFHARLYGRFIEIYGNLRKKKLCRTNQGSSFLGGSFNNKTECKGPDPIYREEQPSILKDDFLQEETHPFSHQ